MGVCIMMCIRDYIHPILEMYGIGIRCVLWTIPPPSPGGEGSMCKITRQLVSIWFDFEQSLRQMKKLNMNGINALTP